MRPHYPFILVLWTTFVLAVPAVGQRPTRSGIGVKAGVQLASLQAAGQSYGSVPGGTAGVYFPFGCGNRLEIQPEVLISAQGATRALREQDAITLRTYYAQVPITAKLFLSNSLNLYAGGYAARLIAAQQDGADATALLKPWDAGAIAGIGLDLMSGFDITARYVSGLTPILMEANNVFPTTHCVQLTAGYRVKRFHHSARRRK